MTHFEIRECTHPACRLRLPIDPEVHQGDFCPRCGALMRCVVSAYANQPCLHDLPKRALSVVLDNVRSAYNVGSIFRTSDGVGVEHLYLCGITPSPAENTALEKTALSAVESVPWTHHLNALTLAGELRRQSYYLIALECTPKSLPIHQYALDLPENQPVALLMGNERAGVDPGLINLCDAVIALPMVGKKASLNVAVAFGVAAYWLSFNTFQDIR